MSSQRFHRARVGFGIVGGLLLTSCGAQQAAGDDKAGGEIEQVVLTMADVYSGLHYEPAVGYFVDRVEELSGGELVIEPTHEWGAFSADAEQLAVRDVASGAVDLAWVGTRVFDTLGVNAFRALTAPMLIDSYPLQDAVISSDIPAEMLDELDELGVAGIAILADGLRKPIAVERPLVSPADFDGIVFETFHSTTQADAIRALGAVPTFSGGGEFDGYEKNLHIYNVNGAQWALPYVAANVNLWPQTVALIADPDGLADLDDTHQEWLMQAGADAAAKSTELADRDGDHLVLACEMGARFANASDAELEAFRDAFETVYAMLERDPQTADFIGRIEALKGATDPGPGLEIPEECTGVSPHSESATTDTAAPSEDAGDTSGPSASDLEGTYRWTVTEEDARADGDPRLVTPDFLSWYPMVATLTLEDGTWELLWRGGDGAEATDGPGPYAAEGDRLRLEWPGDALGHLEFTISVDSEGNLDVEPDSEMQEAAFLYGHYQWELLAGDGGDSPAAAPSLDGTYRWTLSESDVAEHGPADMQTPDVLAWFPLETTVVLDDGQWTMVQRSEDQESRECDSPDCTYVVDGDTITFDWRGATLEFTFTVDEDEALQLQPTGPMNPGDVFVWTIEPWERID